MGVGLPTNVPSNKTFDNYLKSGRDLENVSFLEWLRLVNHTPAIPKRCMGKVIPLLENVLARKYHCHHPSARLKTGEQTKDVDVHCH